MKNFFQGNMRFLVLLCTMSGMGSLLYGMRDLQQSRSQDIPMRNPDGTENPAFAEYMATKAERSWQAEEQAAERAKVLQEIHPPARPLTGDEVQKLLEAKDQALADEKAAAEKAAAD